MRVALVVCLAFTLAACAHRPADPAVALHADIGAPHLAMVVVDSDRVRTLRVIGDNPSVGADTAFHVGSLAKPFAVMVLESLVDDGLLDWTTTVSEILPEVAGGERVTLAQLVGHTAGLPALTAPEDLATVPAFAGAPVEQRLGFTHWVLRGHPVSQRTRTSRYSNAGMTVAAAMAERLTGEEWPQLLRGHVLAPLGLHSAGHGWPPDLPGHWPQDGQLVAVDQHAPPVPAWLAPGGDLYLSPREFATFLQESLRRARSGDPMRAWGRTTSDGREVFVHSGSIGMYYTMVRIDPQRDIAVALMTDAASTDIERDLHRHVMSSRVPGIER